MTFSFFEYIFVRAIPESNVWGILSPVKTLVPLLGDGQLDTVSLGQGDVRLGVLADNENIRQPGGEGVSGVILKRGDLSVKSSSRNSM